MKKQQYEIAVTVDNRSAKDSLMEILETLQKMGKMGTSRRIHVQNGPTLFWDGDGADRIRSIVVHEAPEREE